VPNGPSRAKQTREPRAYVSPRRQRQATETKNAVLEAARSLFSLRGWAGTGMREIAASAQVSVETVYALFGSKPDLFQAALDVAVVGDTAPVPVAERPEFKALGEGRRKQDAIRAGARMVARSQIASRREV
jgi:AcrR family transcriptional regulator